MSEQFPETFSSLEEDLAGDNTDRRHEVLDLQIDTKPLYSKNRFEKCSPFYFDGNKIQDKKFRNFLDFDLTICIELS